ncbi:MAG: class II aldolase, partial [Treponema sp.]|nr:class II aldolase [Treponema sp.]
DEAIWIPSANPGYILSKNVKIAMDKYAEKHHKVPAIIFLQNHGVFAGADSTDIIKEHYGNIMEKIKKKIKRHPDFSDEKILKQNEIYSSPAAEIASELAELGEGTSAFMVNREILKLVKNKGSFCPVSSAFTPDHIVYAGSDPLFIKEGVYKKALHNTWKNHVKKTGRNPKIIAVQNLGIFSAGASEKSASLALVLFKDAIRVAVYSESFGGQLFMTPGKINFINNWEVERFRAGVLIK